MNLELAPPDTAESTVLYLGIDTVPGSTGEFRLVPNGPPAPLGAEFLLRLQYHDGALVDAQLLVHRGYDRGSGRLYPFESRTGEFVRIRTLVNAASRNREGGEFAAIWEDGSTLPLGQAGLAWTDSVGRTTVRLPWSRLNVSDPSQRRILLDPIGDARGVTAQDALRTVQIDEIKLWAHAWSTQRGAYAFLPAQDEAAVVPLFGWEDVAAELVPKQAQATLAEFLPRWFPPAAATNYQ